MPVYNERDTLIPAVKAVLAIDRVDELIVVDDGSTDNTRDLYDDVKALDDRVIVHLQEQNQGKGSAVRIGFGLANGDILLIQDADLEYDPRDYAALVQPIEEGRAAVVYGSRFRGGPTKAMFFWHMIGNKLLTLATNVLYNTILTDMETCYKVFRADIIHDIPLKAKGFEFEPEITSKILKRGYRIYEVPISYHGRTYEDGKKIGWRDGFRAIWCIFRYNLFA